jgi:hypothetical protein
MWRRGDLAPHILNLALDVGELSALIPGKSSQFPLDGAFSGPYSQS